MLRPCYTVQFSQQLVSQRVARQVAEKIAKCNRGFLACFFGSRNVAQSRTRVYFSQRIAATLKPHCTVYHPSATFLAIFEELYSIVHAQSLFTSTTILNLAPNNSPQLTPAKVYCKLLRKLRSVTGPLFFQLLVLQWRCETSCWENCIV